MILIHIPIRNVHQNVLQEFIGSVNLGGSANYNFKLYLHSSAPGG